MLKSEKKKWYYIGSTNRLTERLSEHNKGLTPSTKAYTPLRLVWNKEFNSEKEARNYEQRLKHKRIEKEDIIKKLG